MADYCQIRRGRQFIEDNWFILQAQVLIPFTTQLDAKNALVTHCTQLMALCVGVGMRSETLMNELLSLMANLMRPDERGPAEVAYRAMATLGKILPDRALAALFNDNTAALSSVA